MLKIYYISLLALLVSTSVLYAARSSSRNASSLTQKKSDEAPDSNGGEELDSALGALFADNGDLRRSTEKIIFLGPKNGWGLVAKSTPYYSPTGRHQGLLDAGTLFKYSDVKSSSGHDMLLAVLRQKGGWSEACLLPCTGVAAYAGDPETIDLEILRNLRDYFVLNARVDAAKEKLLQKAYEQNPHYDSYQAAAQAYNQSIAAARKMEADSRKLTGVQKTKALDKMREFKYQQAQLKAVMDEAAQKYKRSRRDHPVDPASFNDPEFTRLNKELEAARSKVKNLIPDETY